MLYVRPIQILMMEPRIVIFQVAWGRVIREWLGDLAPAGWVIMSVTVPEGRRWWRIASHGVTVIWAVFQGNLSIFVQFLKFRSSILEPDFHLKERKLFDW